MARPVVDPAPWSPPRDTRFERIPAAECMRLLERGGVARLAFVHGPTPVIVPVNYVLDGPHVVLRTAPDTLVADLYDGDGVALEIDHVDPVDHTGWSVLLRGRLDRVTDRDELDRLRALPLGVYAPGVRDQWRRITPGTVTGRRITSPSRLWRG